MFTRFFRLLPKRKRLLFGTTAVAGLTGAAFYCNKERNTHNNLFNFFEKFPQIANQHSSMIFMDPKVPINEFQGSITEFIEKADQLNNIEYIRVCGEKLAPGVYDSSLHLDKDKLYEFMKLVAAKGIKGLDFQGAKLDTKDGVIIGELIRKNKTLKILEVTSNQLNPWGMIAILDGLKQNKSVEIFVARSYNVKCYYWSEVELKYLAELVATNTVLKKIILPDNQLDNFPEINLLLKPYEDIKDRPLATISKLQIGRSVSMPDICQENLDALQELSTHRFINHR